MHAYRGTSDDWAYLCAVSGTIVKTATHITFVLSPGSVNLKISAKYRNSKCTLKAQGSCETHETNLYKFEPCTCCCLGYTALASLQQEWCNL